MRYPQGGGLTAERQQFREELRLKAAERFALGEGSTAIARDLYATHEAYAKTVRGDRELKLRGYEVYRFSFTEFGPQGHLEQVLKDFFFSLFERHNVKVPDPH